jgi:murein DD-endopeptidase MepM/ murein hydrolase activator NlpD
MIRVLSYDVDFQRDVQAGDSFAVMLEQYVDKKGKVVREGDLLYAGMTLSGNPISLYRYVDGNGVPDYYNTKGESVKKALLKTPVNGAKLSSGYGNRKHPILGFNKMHKGVDFAAPTGTPIMAAGAGVIEQAGPNGAYGNYVRIRHSSGYSTAYAHMSRFAQGIRAGKRIDQGQIIGFVGSTGRSTGAHLHYEVLVNNDQINPLSIKVPTGTKLAGKELERFNTAMAQTKQTFAQLAENKKVASNAAKAAPLIEAMLE